MKRILYILMAALLLLAATGCAGSAPATQAPAPTRDAEPTPTAQSAVQSLQNDSGRPKNRFDLTVSLDTEKHSLAVKQQLAYVNDTGTELSEIYFNLIPQAFRKQGGGLGIERLTVSGAEAKLKRAKETVYTLPLPQPLAAGDALDIYMEYTVDIPELKNRFGWQDGVYNLGNFIATPAVYGADGWSAEPYVDIGDAFYSDIADYSVSISVPEGYTVAATGERDDSGAYIAKDVRDFAFCVSDSFDTLTAECEGVSLTLYYSAELEKTAQRTLETAKRSLTLFNELFGGYPYPTLTIVMNGLTGGVNGMEYPTLIMLAPEISLEEYERMGFIADSAEMKGELMRLDNAACHEIAHQWFYGIVGNDQIAYPWLDEGLCRFSEYLYQLEYPPDIDADSGIQTAEARLRDQHAFIAREDSSMSYGDDTDYLGESLYYWMEKDPMGYGGIYTKGAAMLYQMRQKLGAEAFGAALKEYVACFAYDFVTPEKFEAFWSEKGDFSALFELYFSAKP